MLGHCEAERAESASDQVDATTLETRLTGEGVSVRGRKLKRFEPLNEALAAAPCDRGVFVTSVHLGDDLRRTLRRFAAVKVEIDGFAVESRKLLVKDARGTQKHSASRIAHKLHVHLLHVI